jgi:hypothetical protein
VSSAAHTISRLDELAQKLNQHFGCAYGTWSGKSTDVPKARLFNILFRLKRASLVRATPTAPSATPGIVAAVSVTSWARVFCCR